MNVTCTIHILFFIKMSPLNYEDIRRIFQKLDKNHDGIVTINEFMLFVDRIGVQASLDELELLVGKKSLDLIDFSFFYDMIIRRSINEDVGNGEEEHNMDGDLLLKAFKVFDSNDDGVISCEELQSTLSRLGLWDEHCLGSMDCRSMIRVYDTNLDGVLDFEEFKNMMLSNS